MSRRILVADDSSTIQKVIKIAFARYAVEIVEAGSYIEALASVSRQPPEALIIDASLPGARGPSDFTKLAGSAGGALVLLLVGTYEAVDEVAFRQAGFEHFLKKPFESSELVAMVDRLLGGSLGMAASPAGQRQVPGADALAPAGAAPPPLRDSQRGVPPPPAPGDRSPSATVVNAGGFQAPLAQEPPPGFYAEQSGTVDQGPTIGLDDDELGSDLGAAGMPPPPPLVADPTRKGRRAFAPGAGTGTGTGTGEGTAGAPRRAPVHISPPPLRLDAEATGDDDDAGEDLPSLPPPARRAPRREEGGEREAARGAARQASVPLPPIPPGTGLGAGRGGRGAAADDDLGLELDDPGEGFARLPVAPPASAPVPSPQRSRSPNAEARSAAPSARMGAEALAELRLLVEEQLPQLVRQAVEEYCDRNFKSLARDVIATELRRLADEKARHLVDN